MRESDEVTANDHAVRPSVPPAEAGAPRADITAISATWRAPLPPPSVLRQYEEVLPGAANRIMEMAEKQGKHRHSMERTRVMGESRRAFLGIIAGFIISVLGIGGGIYLIATGHDWAGLSLAGINLTSLVGVFVYGAKSRHNERNRNVEATPE